MSVMQGHRRATFAAGRIGAAHAMELLDRTPVPVLVGPTREPLWPSGLIGSITHTQQRGRFESIVAYTALAPDPGNTGIGIDAELLGRVTSDLTRRILTDDERLLVERLPPGERDRFVALAFSAKEALYKAQFPLTGAWLGFHDAELDSDGTRIRLVAGGPLTGVVDDPVRVRSLVVDDRIVAAVVVRRSSTWP